MQKYNLRNIIFILALLLCLSFIASENQNENKLKTRYEQMVDSLYQINIKIAIEHGKALETNPNAIRPEPAIWFSDFDGNVYDYPPIRENDSILKAREDYQRKLDSLQGRQFKELNRWNQTTFNKK